MLKLTPLFSPASAALELLRPVIDKGTLTLTSNALVFSLPVSRDASRDAGLLSPLGAPPYCPPRT